MAKLIKLYRAKEYPRTDMVDTDVTHATFNSPRESGYDYVISNEYIVGEGEDIKFTKEQMVDMFSDPEFPGELLASADIKKLVRLHIYLKNKNKQYEILVNEDFKKDEKAKQDAKKKETKPEPKEAPVKKVTKAKGDK